MLEVKNLGQFDIQLDGEPIRIPTRQAQSLLAYLLVNSETAHRREKLAGLIWPDSDEQSARRKLRYALWVLRKNIGTEYFLADRISISINTNSAYLYDVSILETNLSVEDPLEELASVVSVYEGEFLPGFYDDWVILERDRLQIAFEARMRELLTRLLGEGRWIKAIEWSERWIGLGFYPELAFRALMIAHSNLGDFSAAAKSYLQCVEMLKTNLGVDPSALTKEIYELISKGEVPTLRDFTQEIQAVEHAKSPKTESAQQLPEYLKAEMQASALDRAVFVGRERELTQIAKHLDKSLRGDGQVVFLSGDPGQGKTALMREFALRSQEAHKDLVVAMGSCEAHTGIGDPYLPFREILELLSGDIKSHLDRDQITSENARRLWELVPNTADALLNIGPDLISSFVPSRILIEWATSAHRSDSEWVQGLKERQKSSVPFVEAPVGIRPGDFQKNLFDQYTKVINSLAAQYPMIIIIDDLQWADLGSVSLLFHLGRRIDKSRVLIMSAFRPDEIALGLDGKRHPLNKVMTEFRRLYGRTEINLEDTDEGERRTFIDAILDLEPNLFDDDFRNTLYRHTQAHPLFTIELLSELRKKRYLVEDDKGNWVASSNLDWGTLPTRVEAVIEERVARLGHDHRQILDVAAVFGEVFIAEVVADVLGATSAEIVQHLSSELAKQHHLVEALGVETAKDYRLSRYKFRHQLFQKYLYESLDDVEKSYLHLRIGDSLEKISGLGAEDYTINLARHYKESGNFEKAVDYLLAAGDKAKLLSANTEAIEHLSNGIKLVGVLPNSVERNQKELSMQLSLGSIQIATKGYTAPEVEHAFARARSLSEEIGEVPRLIPPLWGLWSFYLVRSDNVTAETLALKILSLAQREEDPGLALVGHWTTGISRFILGDFQSALEHLDAANSIYDPENHKTMKYLYGQDPGVTCLSFTSLTLVYLGYLDQARRRIEDALNLAESISHPHSLVFAQGIASMFYSLILEIDRTLGLANSCVDISSIEGFPFWYALGEIMRSWALSKRGDEEMGIKTAVKALENMGALGAFLGQTFFISLLVDSLCQTRQFERAMEWLQNAIQLANTSSARYHEANLYRLRGLVLLGQESPLREVEASYTRAMEIARTQRNKVLELKVAMDLSQLLRDSGEGKKGRVLLKDTLKWFTEGEGTILIRDSKNILRNLG